MNNNHSRGRIPLLILCCGLSAICSMAQENVDEVFETEARSLPEEPSPMHAISGDNSDVTLPSGLTAFDAMLNIFNQIPLHPNYREMLTTNDLARLRAEPSTFDTAVPTPWETALREVVRPYGFDFVKEGDIVRLGPRDEIDNLYLLLEQERLRSNHRRIQVKFSEGTLLYVALRVIQSEAGININFDYMDPEDRGIVQYQELNTGEVAEPEAHGNQTTYATPENQPTEWRVVMKEVLNPFGYDFAEVGGVVRPGKHAKIKEWETQQIDAKPLVTRIVRIHHVSPEELITRLEAMKLTKHTDGFVQLAHGWKSEGKLAGNGEIKRHSSPPAVIVRDIEENMDTIIEEIKRLDARARQVMIEVRILDLGTDSSRQLGILFEEFGGSLNFGSQYGSSAQRGGDQSWSSSSSLNSGSESSWSVGTGGTLTEADQASGGSTVANSNNRNTLRNSTWGRGFDLILNPLQMNATWSMLQTATDAKIVSQPVLVVPDNAEAMINATRTEPYYVETDTTVLEEGAVNQTTGTWEEEEIGTKLNVIPEITADGLSVRLTVLPVVTELLGYAEASEAINAPKKPKTSTRSLDTRVTVRSGDTLLMGGLISARTTSIETRVPFLSAIPLIGRLFRHTNDSEVSQTLVMLITPTILDDELPSTGYERPIVPHFEQLKMKMNTALRQGIDDETLAAIEDKMKRDMQQDHPPAAVVLPAKDEAMDERMRDIDARLMQEMK